MAITTYEELIQLADKSRKATLTLEVDMGSSYSQEYEDAKAELAQAKALKQLTGNTSFLGDNFQELEAKVASLKPESQSIWVKFSRLPLTEWAALLKQSSLQPIDQYEQVLPKSFIGVYGSDDDNAEPLSTDPKLFSSKGSTGILPGGILNKVVSAFISWQNSGGDVTINPTKSSRG